jgi:hypothetical protein
LSSSSPIKSFISAVNYCNLQSSLSTIQNSSFFLSSSYSSNTSNFPLLTISNAYSQSFFRYNPYILSTHLIHIIISSLSEIISIIYSFPADSQTTQIDTLVLKILSLSPSFFTWRSKSSLLLQLVGLNSFFPSLIILAEIVPYVLSCIVNDGKALSEVACYTLLRLVRSIKSKNKEILTLLIVSFYKSKNYHVRMLFIDMVKVWLVYFLIAMFLFNIYIYICVYIFRLLYCASAKNSSRTFS